LNLSFLFIIKIIFFFFLGRTFYKTLDIFLSTLWKEEELDKTSTSNPVYKVSDIISYFLA